MSKAKIKVRMTATRPGPGGKVLMVDTDHALPEDLAHVLIANNWANALPVVPGDEPAPVEVAEPVAVADPVDAAAAVKPAKAKAHRKPAPKAKG